MKNSFVFLIALFLFSTCKETIVQQPTEVAKGSISVDSNPKGMHIFLQGTNTGKITPDNITDTQTNYVFLYDQDLHYSKLKIVNRGGGNQSEASWVEVQWIYNTKTNDQRF